MLNPQLSLVCRARRHALIRAASGHAAANRRLGADQTRVRGGCSGGEYPRPSGRKSFCGWATPEETANGGWKSTTVRAGKQLAAQAAMKTHLSHPIAVGLSHGQQGMSAVIASAVADADLSSVIAGIDTSDTVPAMAGRANGARTRPAIMNIASSRRMVIWRSMRQSPTDGFKLKASRTNDAVMGQARCFKKPSYPKALGRAGSQPGGGLGRGLISA
jgi:hypothetical protein